MYITGANKFTYPLLVQRGYLSSWSRKWWKQEWFGKEKKVLGRWNLKHTESELNKFYQYIPDPGYPNNYGTKQLAGVVLDSSLQYNHLGKTQN